MRRWDSVVEGFLTVCEGRGLSEDWRQGLRSELDRWGSWLKRRRPKPNLEEVDGAMVIAYVRQRTAFRAKATVAGVASKLRCLGEYLVAQGIWRQNPLRWIKGPRLDARGKLPRRIGAEHLQKLWEATGQQRSKYQQHLGVAALSLLYGTGLRRGELERLNVGDWQREENLLKIDGRKTGRERSVPLSAEMARCLEAYLPARHNLLEECGTLGEEALLVNRQGRRLITFRS